MAHQLAKQFFALAAVILLARGQDSMYAKLFCLFHSSKRICTKIKGPVQGNTHISGGLDQLLHTCQIQSTVRTQHTDHNPLGTKPVKHFDFL